MSDTQINQFLGSGTAAEMAAHVPVPPTPASGPDNGYFFFNTDDNIVYGWDGAAWIAPAGTGDVTASGTLTSGAVIVGGGTTVVAATATAAGILTFIGTPSSANLAAAVTGETGTGALVFGTSPTLVTPALGTPASGVATNLTGLPLTTGVTGALPIANGGTANTTATAAFDALAPTTTAGDLIYSNGTDNVRLGIGTALQVLRTNAGATAPEWATGGAGKLVQQVNVQTGAVATGTTTIPFDDTIPQITEGTEFMTLAVTPTSATNILLIEVEAFATVTTTPWIALALFQDATAGALAAVAGFVHLSTTGRPIALRHRMVSGTTSATTFRVRLGPSGASTVTFNGQSAGRIFGGVMASSITISEIVP